LTPEDRLLDVVVDDDDDDDDFMVVVDCFMTLVDDEADDELVAEKLELELLETEEVELLVPVVITADPV